MHRTTSAIAILAAIASLAALGGPAAGATARYGCGAS